MSGRASEAQVPRSEALVLPRLVSAQVGHSARPVDAVRRNQSQKDATARGVALQALAEMWRWEARAVVAAAAEAGAAVGEPNLPQVVVAPGTSGVGAEGAPVAGRVPVLHVEGAPAAAEAVANAAVVPEVTLEVISAWAAAATVEVAVAAGAAAEGGVAAHAAPVAGVVAAAAGGVAANMEAVGTRRIAWDECTMAVALVHACAECRCRDCPCTAQKYLQRLLLASAAETRGCMA